MQYKSDTKPEREKGLGRMQTNVEFAVGQVNNFSISSHVPPPLLKFMGKKMLSNKMLLHLTDLTWLEKKSKRESKWLLLGDLGGKVKVVKVQDFFSPSLLWSCSLSPWCRETCQFSFLWEWGHYMGIYVCCVNVCHVEFHLSCVFPLFFFDLFTR